MTCKILIKLESSWSPVIPAMCQITVMWHKIGETAAELRFRNIHRASPTSSSTSLFDLTFPWFYAFWETSKRWEHCCHGPQFWFCNPWIVIRSSREKSLRQGPQFLILDRDSRESSSRCLNPESNSNLLKAAVNNLLKPFYNIALSPVCLSVNTSVLHYSIQKKIFIKEEENVAFRTKFTFHHGPVSCMEGSCLLNLILK